MRSSNEFNYKYEHVSLESNPKSINTLSSDVFTIIDSNDGKIHSIPMHLSLLSEEWKSVLRLHFIAWCGGYVDSKNRIRIRVSTCKSKAETVRMFASYIHQYCSDKPLTQWKLDDISDLFIKVTLKKVGLMDFNTRSFASKGELLNCGAVAQISLFIRKSHQLYVQGIVPNGITEQLPTYLLKKSLKDALDARGVCFSEWLRGGTLGTVPTHIAMLMVAEAINTLRSYETKLAIAYFGFMRTNELTVREAIGPSGAFTGHKDYFTIGKLGLYKVLDAVEKPENVFELPKLTLHDFNKVCKEAYQASLVIFLCLTGIRLSELVTVEGRYYRKEIDGCWTFDSSLVKTNHGITEIRTMSGLVAEACDVLMKVSYIDKLKTTAKLFEPTFSEVHYYQAKAGLKNIKKLLSLKAACRALLNHAFQRLIDKHGDHIKDECPKVTPHMFRHTFAEFAIRRFDGDVLEAIRQHFRHAAGSYFTLRYAGEKLRPEIEEQIEKAYLKEILMKFADLEFEDDFVGKAALKIKKIVRAQTQTASPEEIEDIINDLAEEIEGITPHSYGVCLAFKDQMHLAKCKSPTTGLPEYENGAFAICPGCPNNLSSKSSNKENIIQMVLSHQDFLDKYPLKSAAAIKISIIAVENGERILKEMEQ